VEAIGAVLRLLLRIRELEKGGGSEELKMGWARNRMTQVRSRHLLVAAISSNIHSKVATCLWLLFLPAPIFPSGSSLHFAPFGWNYKPVEKHCWLIFVREKYCSS
jgi:hypothetical protein